MYFKSYILLFSSLLFIGCGGEIDSYYDDNRINFHNAEKIAKEVLQAQLTVNDIGILTGQGFDNIQRSRKSRTTYSDEYSCYYGGSASTVFQDEDDDTFLSSGDIFTIDYHSCGIQSNDFQGSIDGEISLHFYEIYEDANADVLDYLVSYKDTYMDSQRESLKLNGAMQVYYYDDRVNDDLYLKFYTDQLITDTEHETMLLEKTKLDFFSDVKTEYYEYTFDGKLYNDTVYKGTLTFTTTELFQGYGDAHPHRGELFVEGKRDSALLIQVINERDIDLLIDSNGDGYSEYVIQTKWSALL